MSFRDIPLPPNWEEAVDAKTGKPYYIDHENKCTTWIDPRHWYDPSKPKTFAECKNNELPLGWEEVNDQRYGTIYMNHITRHVQVTDPRLEFMAEKQRMINNFVSLARSDKSDRTPSSRGSTPTNQLPNHHSDQLDIEKMKRDNELSKQRLESLRREVKINLGINDLKKERDHVKNLIIKTDERIDKLMRELRKTEPKTQALLNVAEKERQLAEAAILHVSSSDPVKAREEQERKCEILKMEFQRAKQINNENLKNEVKNAERREEIIKQVQQENQSRQRLALMLDSLTQPGRRIDRSQTFSDHPHRPDKVNDDRNKVISLIDLTGNSAEKHLHILPDNLLKVQVGPRRAGQGHSAVSINSPNNSGCHIDRDLY